VGFWLDAEAGWQVSRHQLERAAQHYGLELTNHDLRAIAALCGHGVGQKIATRDGYQVWRVLYRGRQLLVVYDPELWRVITLLHPAVVLRPNGTVDARASIAAGAPSSDSWVVHVLKKFAARGAR